MRVSRSLFACLFTLVAAVGHVQAGMVTDATDGWSLLTSASNPTNEGTYWKRLEATFDQVSALSSGLFSVATANELLALSTESPTGDLLDFTSLLPEDTYFAYESGPGSINMDDGDSTTIDRARFILSSSGIEFYGAQHSIDNGTEGTTVRTWALRAGSNPVIANVPEPSTLTFFSVALVIAFGIYRRTQKQTKDFSLRAKESCI